MRSRFDLRGELPTQLGPRIVVMLALVVGGLVAVGLTALIVVFLVTAFRR